MSEPLDPDTALDVRLSATISRHQFTTDPAPALEALRVAAGDRADILARVAGVWAGYHEPDAEMAAMVAALRTVPGAEEWVQLGRERRGVRWHSQI